MMTQQFSAAALPCMSAAAGDPAWHCAVLEALPVPAFAIDAGHRIIAWNEACARLTGFAAGDMIGTTRAWAAFYPEQQPLSSDLVLEDIDMLMGDKDGDLRHQDEARQVLADLIVDGADAGQIASQYDEKCIPAQMAPGAFEAQAYFPKLSKWLYFCAAPVHGANGHVVGAVEAIRDITESVEGRKELEYRTTHDILTGLPNRALARDRLEQALKQATLTKNTVALLFVDLDGFKFVNDTLGHSSGDLLLQQVVARLLDCLRDGDTLARLAGDEFVALLPEQISRENVSAIGERFIAVLKAPFRLKDKEVQISASIGIALFPEDATDADSLMRHADTAMYLAKDRGKGQAVFFTGDLRRRIDDWIAIKNGLARALERNEFELHFQPKSSLANGQITGVEALLRWTSPQLGAVGPHRFIPVLEETGQIDAVGHWVFDEACRHQSKWLARGHSNLRMSVNLSARQLWNPTLTRRVALMLQDHDLPPSCIELELTESMIMRDPDQALELLRGFSDMGLHLAMDDFGTGYSSLSYLKRFPIRTIKIDRSFITDLASDPDDMEIVRTIITMGRSLRRTIIAEGVETEQQRAILQALGCHEIQGYLLSPPMAADAMELFLDGARSRCIAAPVTRS